MSRDLCEIATRAGFRVTVVDDREAFANEERFPAARPGRGDHPTFAEAFAHSRPTSSTYCVVVTRGHAMDLECTDYALAHAGPLRRPDRHAR